MFLGQFYHNLDDKGRMMVPARFREFFSEEAHVYVMQGFDQNLMVLPSNAFEAMSRRVSQMSLTDPTARLLRRLLFSTAERLSIDRAGRILISQFLRQFAGLDAGVVVVGAGDYFELWSQECWAAQNEQLQDAQANAQRFSALSLTSD
jgi:MraZ protein